jgi:hypothetical protein
VRPSTREIAYWSSYVGKVALGLVVNRVGSQLVRPCRRTSGMSTSDLKPSRLQVEPPKKLS